MLQKISTKLKRKGTEYLYNVAYKTGLLKHKIQQNQQLILCYHGIDLAGSTYFNSRFISYTYFEQQLIYFKKNFQTVSLADFFKLEINETTPFTIALTFDDGYKNNFKYVLPLLEKYQIPATFFITGINDTDYDMLWPDYFDLAHKHYHQDINIDNQHFTKNWRGQYKASKSGTLLKRVARDQDFAFKKQLLDVFPETALQFKKDSAFDDYWQQMSNVEILQLSQSPYATVGVHGYYHNDLSKIPLDKAIIELERTKAFLENITQQAIPDLAYPHGNYSLPLVQEAEKMGFSRQLALAYSSPERPACLRDRFGMNPYHSWDNQLRYLIRGGYF